MTAIEKAFAINAEPGVIWDALWTELSQSEAARFAVDSSHRPESLAIDVDMGGIPSRISYRITPRDGFSEVSATLEPSGTRFFWLQIMTFGRLRTQYEMVLVQGLANLKAAIEGPEEEIVESGEANSS